MSPTDISYVFNGYSPISVKIIELMFNNHGLGSIASKGMLKLIGLTDDKIKIPMGD